MSEAQHERGLAAVRGHGARRRFERRRRFLAVGGVTAAMGAAAFLLAPRVLHRMHEGPPPLALQVESGAIDPAGAIVARDEGETSLHFAGGSVFDRGRETSGPIAGVAGTEAVV